MLRSRRQSSMMKVILAILFVTALMVPSGKKCNSHQSDTDSSFFPVQEVITTCAQSGLVWWLKPVFIGNSKMMQTIKPSFGWKHVRTFSFRLCVLALDVLGVCTVLVQRSRHFLNDLLWFFILLIIQISYSEVHQPKHIAFCQKYRKL
jgi:hypothetical protein